MWLGTEQLYILCAALRSAMPVWHGCCDIMIMQ